MELQVPPLYAIQWRDLQSQPAWEPALAMVAKPSSRVLEQLSFASAPALFSAVWLSAGILLEPYLFIMPGALIAVILLLVVASAFAASKALRVALLPAGCTWVLLGLLLAEIEPAPDPQTQLSSIAEQGAAMTIEGVVVRTTPIRLTESTQPYGNTTRVEQSESFDLHIDSVGASQ